MKARITVAVLLLAFLAVTGAVFEQVERKRDRVRFPQVGRSVDIGGRSLNLFCSGEGSPAAIFESDALTPGYSWTFIQRQVAGFTHACWYDRAGYGWSDSAPAPHTSRESARDLHSLLHAAGVPPPYILVGAGFGAFNVRVFRALYRDEVAGMVLSNAAHEDELVRFPEEQGNAGKVPLHLGFPPDLLLRAVSSVGLMRLTVHGNGRNFTAQGFTPAEQATLTGLQSQPKVRAAFLAEQGFSSGPDEVRAAGNLDGLPLIVLASDTPPENARQISRNEAKRQMQQQLAKLSTRGRLVLVKDNEGAIQFEVPGAIVQAVRDVRQAIP